MQFSYAEVFVLCVVFGPFVVGIHGLAYMAALSVSQEGTKR